MQLGVTFDLFLLRHSFFVFTYLDDVISKDILCVIGPCRSLFIRVMNINKTPSFKSKNVESTLNFI